jgi:protein required for attachment to host cells
MLVPHDCCILVVDGGRMQILRNHGQPASPDLTRVAEYDNVNPASFVLESDAPGRSHDSHGPGSHAYPAADLHQRSEDAFAARALAELQIVAGNGEPVIIIAPPRILGQLRPLFDHGLRARIIGEMNKDLAHRPPAEIAVFLRTHQE